ncbi:Efflux pump aflT [Lachnellula arida]|uniref:Efflux pump aflT n=1 Tax=Lachnellula arida TaxID=1316785 RepID=A0A8T9BI44_9HELO|nr:Efflux pump aflT [Lachnellula arida]
MEAHTPENKSLSEAKDEEANSNKEQQDPATNDTTPAPAPTHMPSPDDAMVPTSNLRFFLIFIALILSIFCVALDNTIIVTAIPRITDTFNLLNDVGWYGSAFNLPAAALIPFTGKLYSMFSTKTIFLASFFIFEVGSLLSAVAPSSLAFVIGRALCGAGAAGIFNGAYVTIFFITPLRKRPAYQTIIGGTYAIATVTAPLIGGAFTDSVTWRWCFYINLPIGGLGAALLNLVLHLPSPPRSQETWSQVLWKLDLVGQITFIPSIICLLLALQLGGTRLAWSSGRIIALLVLFPVLLIAFVINEFWMGDNATLPRKILQRSVASASCFAFCNYAQLFVFIYFIPIYFQAIKGVDAEQSGIHSIPLIVANNITSLLTGLLTTKFGTFVQYFYGCSILTSIGAGLITTWKILAGIGTGFALDLPQVAVQPSLAPQDIPIGISTTIFFQFFGGCLFTSIANNIFNGKLVDYIVAIGIPNFDPSSVVSAGATDLRNAVPAQFLQPVLVAYNLAIRRAFQAGLAMACLSILAALPLEWKSVKRAPPGKTTHEENGEKSQEDGRVSAKPLQEDVQEGT